MFFYEYIIFKNKCASTTHAYQENIHNQCIIQIQIIISIFKLFMIAPFTIISHKNEDIIIISQTMDKKKLFINTHKKIFVFPLRCFEITKKKINFLKSFSSPLSYFIDDIKISVLYFFKKIKQHRKKINSVHKNIVLYSISLLHYFFLLPQYESVWR